MGKVEGNEQYWVKLAAAELFLIATLGYDDEDELQDAMNGTLLEFLQGLPNCEIKENEEGEHMFQFLRREPKDPQVLKLHITQREQLWVTLLRDPKSIMLIPEIEFQSGHSHKRQIDSVYNHIAQHKQHLGDHVDGLVKQEGADGAVIVAIHEQIDELGKCLDLDMPFTIVVRDPRGLSEFKPDAGVIVEPYVEEGNNLPKIAEEDEEGVDPKDGEENEEVGADPKDGEENGNNPLEEFGKID